MIADAILTYLLVDDDGAVSIAYRFVELDRGNRSTAELARGVGRYARLHRRTIPAEDPALGRIILGAPLPGVPGLLVVLAGGPPEALRRRRSIVLALCRADPMLASTPEVEVSICLLDDLIERGPLAPIFRSPERPETDADLLGR